MAETKRSRLRISELNPHLLCALCGGYLIDATTIVECLHSFCKTCILRYLETSNYCPICEVLIHKKRPWQNIRLDHTLQNAVYKIVPGLFKREMQRRRAFYEISPPPGKNGFAEQVHTAPERIIFSEDEKFSVSLEFSPNGRPIHDEKKDSKAVTVPALHRDKRFLLCPANVCVGHLKKFVRLKYSLPECYQIDLFYSDEPLDDHYSLMDVAYIYSWRRESVLTLYYSFHQPPPKLRKLTAPATATSQDSLPSAARVKSDSSNNNNNSTSTSTTNSSSAATVGASDNGSSRNCSMGDDTVTLLDGDTKTGSLSLNVGVISTLRSATTSSSTTTKTKSVSTPAEEVAKNSEGLSSVQPSSVQLQSSAEQLQSIRELPSSAWDEDTDDEDDERKLVICTDTPAADIGVFTSATTISTTATTSGDMNIKKASTDSRVGGAVPEAVAVNVPTPLGTKRSPTGASSRETVSKPYKPSSPSHSQSTTSSKPSSTPVKSLNAASTKPSTKSTKLNTAIPKATETPVKPIITSPKISMTPSTPVTTPAKLPATPSIAPPKPPSSNTTTGTRPPAPAPATTENRERCGGTSSPSSPSRSATIPSLAGGISQGSGLRGDRLCQDGAPLTPTSPRDKGTCPRPVSQGSSPRGDTPLTPTSPRDKGTCPRPVSQGSSPRGDRLCQDGAPLTPTSPRDKGTSPRPVSQGSNPRGDRLCQDGAPLTPTSPRDKGTCPRPVSQGSSPRGDRLCEDGAPLTPTSPRDKGTSPRPVSQGSRRSPSVGIFERIYSVTSNCTPSGGIKSIFKTTALVPASNVHRRASDITGVSPAANSGNNKVERRASCSSGSLATDRPATTCGVTGVANLPSPASQPVSTGEATHTSIATSPNSNSISNNNNANIGNKNIGHPNSGFNATSTAEKKSSVPDPGSKTVPCAERQVLPGAIDSPATQRFWSTTGVIEAANPDKQESAIVGSTRVSVSVRPVMNNAVSLSDKRPEPTSGCSRSVFDRTTQDKARPSGGPSAIVDRRPSSGGKEVLKIPGAAAVSAVAQSKSPGSNSGGAIDGRTASVSNSKDRRLSGATSADRGASKDTSSGLSDAKSPGGNKYSDSAKSFTATNMKPAASGGSAGARDYGAINRPLTLSSTSLTSDRRFSSGGGATTYVNSSVGVTQSLTSKSSNTIVTTQPGPGESCTPCAATDSRLAALASSAGLAVGIKRSFSASTSGSDISRPPTGVASNSDGSKKSPAGSGGTTSSHAAQDASSAVRVAGSGGSGTKFSETKRQKTSSGSNSQQSPANTAATCSPAVITPTILSSSSPSKAAGRGVATVNTNTTAGDNRQGVRLPAAGPLAGNKTTFSSATGRVGGPKGQAGTNLTGSSGRVLPPGNRVDSLLFRKTNDVRAAASAKRDSPLGSTLGGAPSAVKRARSDCGVDSFFNKTFGGGKCSQETAVVSGAGGSMAGIGFSARHILSPAFHSHSGAVALTSSPNSAARSLATSAKKNGGNRNSGACDLGSKSSSSLLKSRSNGSSPRTSEGIKLDIPRLSSSSRDSVFISDSDTSPTPSPKYSDINRNPIKMEHSPTALAAGNRHARKDSNRPLENGRGSRGSVGSPNSVGSGPGSPLESERSPARDARRPSDSELLVGHRWHGLHPHMHPHAHLLQLSGSAAMAALYNGHFKVPPSAKFLTLAPDHMPPTTAPEDMPLDYSTTSSSSSSSAKKS